MGENIEKSECEKNRNNVGFEKPKRGVPNICVLGMTGAGKSYFLNGILGNKNPETGPFGVGRKADSCTREVSGYHGRILNGEFGAYGVSGLEANFFDTPGFSDSDICLIEKNKKQIAQNFERPIDMFVYLYPAHNPRFNSNLQHVFKQLNDWTMGNIWNNFVIVFGRTTFYASEVDSRFENDESIRTQKQELVDEIKKALGENAVNDGWKRTLPNGEEREMTSEDFESIQFSLLNFILNPARERGFSIISALVFCSSSNVPNLLTRCGMDTAC